MNYRVAIPRSLKRKILAWDLPVEIKRQYLEWLRDFLSTADVSRLGREIVAPVRAHIVKYTVVCPGEWGEIEFVTWVNAAQRPDTRVVLDADFRT